MAVTSTGSNSIDTIRGQYTPKDTSKQDAIGRDTFMTMLVAQLKNQDPLNPLEGTDFATQLAQFTSLEESMNTNEKLGELIEVTRGKNAASNSLNYIGKVVRAESDKIEVEGGKVTGGFFTLESKGDVAAVIYDGLGREIKHIYQSEIDPGSYNIKWDGTDDQNRPVADGNYTFKVASRDANGAISDVKTVLQGEVSGVGYENNKAYLVVGTGRVDPESVTNVTLKQEQQAEGS